MIDREKVIKGLEMCIADDFCNGCPYESTCFKDGNATAEQLMRDAVVLLKEQDKIVRCRDCKHHGKDTCSAAAGMAYPTPADWFCADGERSVKQNAS